MINHKKKCQELLSLKIEIQELQQTQQRRKSQKQTLEKEIRSLGQEIGKKKELLMEKI